MSDSEMHCILTKKRGNAYHILSARPPSRRLTCDSQAAAVQHPAVAWESSRRLVCTTVQGSIDACSGDPPLRKKYKRGSSKALPGGVLLCLATPASALPGETELRLKSAPQLSPFPSSAMMRMEMGRNLAKIRFPVQGRELNSHK